MGGPLFDFEWSQANRRGRLDLLCRVYAFILLLQLLLLARSDTPTVHEYSQRWLGWFLTQQVVLIVFLTPMLTAGAIGDEKARGSMQFLLTTDLNAWEIVVGKCLGRLASVTILLAVGLPTFGFLAGFAGFPFTVVLLLPLFLLTFCFAVGAFSVLAAVWTRQTRQAVMAVYLVGGALTLAGWMLRRYLAPPRTPGPLPPPPGLLHDLLNQFDLLYILAPTWSSPDPPELARRLFAATLVWLAASSFCLALAVWRLRPAYLKQLVARSRIGRWLQRAELTDEPVRWKEAHVERAVPMPLIGTVPGWVGALVFFVVMLAWSGFSLMKQMDRHALLLQQSAGVIFIASLLVGIRASGAVTGEREHNTWDTLLTTPLQTDELLRGKLQGILDTMTPFLIAYGVFALVPSVVMADVVAGALTLLALGATWLAMYLLGAAGILCSARASSSGQSLFNTLVTGYGPSNLRACVAGTRITFFVASLFFVLTIAYPMTTAQSGGGSLMLVGVFGLAVCLALGPGLALWQRAQDYLDTAIAHVDKRERVRQKRTDDPLGPYAEFR
jgi:ABC-type transport system involved in multi-copper enzyme maturation permease subunit